MKTNSQDGGASLWAKPSVANLVRYVPCGVYFARAKVGGKLIRRSLRTDKRSVAQLRLGDLMEDERTQIEARVATGKGQMAFGDNRSAFARVALCEPSAGRRMACLSTAAAQKSGGSGGERSENASTGSGG